MSKISAKKTIFQRLVVILILTALVLFHFTTPVWASPLEGYVLLGYKFTGGIATVSYSIYNPHSYTAGTGATYASLIDAAQNDWEYMLAGTQESTFVSVSTTASGCKIFFVLNNSNPDYNLYAGCQYYSIYGNPVSDIQTFGEPYQNYSYVYVICYQQNLSTLTSNYKVRAVMAHETGHALGLGHVFPENGGRAIMEDPITSTNIYQPQKMT